MSSPELVPQIISVERLAQGHALMRLVGNDLATTIHANYSEDTPPEDLITGVLRGEFSANGSASAPFLLPGFYFPQMVSAVDAIGPLRAVGSLEACADAVAHFETYLPPSRLGQSLAPFAKGLVLLAVAEALRGRDATHAERIFGRQGKTHAGALRQVLNPTKNRQANLRRESRAALEKSPNPTALEAWRALEAWTMVMPDRQSVLGLVPELAAACGRPAPKVYEPAFAAWLKEALEVTGQVALDAILPGSIDSQDVFELGAPATEAQRKALAEIIRTTMVGRCSATPNAPGVLHPAYKFLQGWHAMVGEEEALGLLGEFSSNLVLSAKPFSLVGNPTEPFPEEAWVREGLYRLVRSFQGTKSFCLAYAIFAGFLTEWDRSKRHQNGDLGFVRRDAGLITCTPDSLPVILNVLEHELPLAEAPWVEADAVVSAMAMALLETPDGGGSLLGNLIAYADQKGFVIA